MIIPKRLKISVAFLMSFMLTNTPHLAFANEAMIQTSAVVSELSREQAKQNIQGYLDLSELRDGLVKSGVSPEEVSARLASLSDTEIRQLSHQMDEARAGGDILITILVVVLIIFLIKRL